MIRSIVIAVAALGSAVTPAAAAPPAVSAPLANIRYDVTFTRETAAQHALDVRMTFDVSGPGDVLLSLPSWTPGAYEVTNFARWVADFSPAAGDRPLHWDKLDYDTWRIRPAGSRTMTVDFTFRGDSLDNAMTWEQADFAFFNGTNLFLYPEGRSLAFPATVRIHTESDWLVATGMHGGNGTYQERNYHDLVDMPFFVGRMDYDSATVGGLTVRLASYPAGALAGEARSAFWADYKKLFAPETTVFGETPFDSYTTLMVFPPTYGGGSALEHQNSHLGIYAPQGIGQTWLTSVTAHEMFHAFNVKRMRPGEMVPYRYDVAQPTPWLWVSEGITDYYADLMLLRAGIVDSTGFLDVTNGKIANVDDAPPVALEDASLSTWIHPTDGSGYLYYPKGSLAGFMLDILIRNASDNHRSLDDVMRAVYTGTFKAGRGFGGAEWWGAVARASGRKDWTGFNDRYVDGREPFPWDSILPLAGLRIRVDTLHEPRLGVQFNLDSAGIIVAGVVPGGAGEAAGLQNGDILLALGDVTISGIASFDDFRTAYSGRDGQDMPIRIRRGGEEVTLAGKVRIVERLERHLEIDPAATDRAVRVRHGLFAGVTQ
jgi:predicted metalloprotease with PDZ domain